MNLLLRHRNWIWGIELHRTLRCLCSLSGSLARFAHVPCNGRHLSSQMDKIHDEWIRNVLANRADLKPEQQLERTRMLMNAHVDDCLISGYAVVWGISRRDNPHELVQVNIFL
jgi:hypothetical protein